MVIRNRFKTVKQLLTGVSLFLGVTLSNSLAQAALTCEDLFGQFPSVVSLQGVTKISESLVDEMKSPNMLTSQKLLEKNQKLEAAIEEYLGLVGITFQRVQTLDWIRGLEDKNSFMFYRNTYEIKGSREGGAEARMLHGLAIHPEYQGSKLIIELDPLYGFKKSGEAEFLPLLTRITIGPHEFMNNMMGIGASLRHEAQHFIEQDKLNKGQQSLARFEFRSKTPDPEVVYSDFLRGDEIETHLRDLRYFSNFAHHEARAADLTRMGMSEKALKNLENYREVMYTEKKSYLVRFIKELKLSIAHMEAAMKKETPWDEIRTTTKGDVQVAFLLGKNYDGVGINFRAQLNSTDATKVKAALADLITWTKQRLATVEKQMNQIENRRN